MNRILRLLGLPLGIAILAWLVLRSEPAALFGVFPRIGWGFVAIVVARLATVFVDCGAWRCLLPPRGRPSFWVMLPLRWISESINTTLPAAQIGGQVVRARLLQRRLDAPARGAASVAVDFCLSLLSQILFTLLGFVLLAQFSATAWWLAAIAAASVPLFAVFSWEMLVRQRLLAALERWSARIGQRRLAGALQQLGGALALLADSRAALARSLSLHVTSWLGHAAEVWLTLWLMGAPTGAAEALILESLSLAARSAAFLIPSGWGAQEAALVALASVTGLPAETALALGLVKRAREFAVGLPGLAAWAIAEGKLRVRIPG
ncbi:MAG: flippase-like domain-containing protein [Alphaproteobacteria bacterium]|nr:flippase-like domain-containing protein [Alphaproteobacteria bacterium]